MTNPRSEAQTDMFTAEWLASAGLRFTEASEAGDLAEERKGFQLACSLVSNFAVVDPETINVNTLKFLNGDYSEAVKRGYLHGLGVLAEAWRAGADA